MLSQCQSVLHLVFQRSCEGFWNHRHLNLDSNVFFCFLLSLLSPHLRRPSSVSAPPLVSNRC